MNRVSNITRRHRRIVQACCVTFWIAAMIATHIPAGRLPHMSVSDKFLHAACYFVLAAMFWLTLWAYEVGRPSRIAYVFFAASAYAAIDEMTQPLVGRVDSLGDWAADAFGAAVALVACEVLLKALTPKRRRPIAPTP